MRCPRCQRASPDAAVFCPACGAPLALRAEPAPHALDTSISLDRRAGDREPAFELREAERSASWDLGPPAGAPDALGPSIGADAVEDGPEDFQFGPLPELAPDLGPALDAEAAGPETFGGAVIATAGSLGSARHLDRARPLSRTLGLEPDPVATAGSLGSARHLDRARPLSRALGLEPDPVHPDDLGLARGPENDAEPTGGGPTALDRDLDLDDPSGDAAPPAFAAAERDLALDHPAAARAPRTADPLDLAIDLGREALAGTAVGALAHGGSALDLGLAAVPRRHDVQLPLPRPTPRPRAAPAGRRAASWVIDAAPFVAGWAGTLVALYDRVPGSPGASPSTSELVLRDGGAIALPLLACFAILALVYQTLAHALAGATLGKRLLGLRVVGPDGARPSFGRSAARAAMSGASTLLLGLGLAPALFTRSGRALHDISSGTQVVEAP